jgi:hypothetical protein
MYEMTRRRLLLAGGAAAAVAGTGLSLGLPAGVANADPDDDDAAIRLHGRPDQSVVEWNRTLLRIVRTAGAQPATVHATRSFAILHAAIYDAVVSALGVGRPYRFRVVAGPGASAEAAAVQAAHDTLAALYPSMVDSLNAQLAADLAALPDNRARARGVRIGATAAKLVLGLRTGDGSAATPPAIPAGTAPGQYRPTPPAFAAAVFTHWSAVSPWVIDRADQFRSAPFPDLASTAYADALNEVQSLGQDTSTTRTADQTVQARFWAASIWNYWNEIAQSAVTAHGSDLFTAARVFADLTLTFADSVIAFYDSKYHFRIWRPVTAIRLADTDGNPATTANPAWNPLATTPNDPSYPGAHSVVSQAGATVLSRHFGPREHIVVASESLPGTTRTFEKFQDIADEAGLSRIFAGVHTRLDHVAGQKLGGDLARFVLSDDGLIAAL